MSLPSLQEGKSQVGLVRVWYASAVTQDGFSHQQIQEGQK